MKKLFVLISILVAMNSISIAQESKIKDLYTNITTQINSVLLTRKSSLEFSGFAAYNQFKTGFKNNEEISRQTLLS
jgi:hypothetical protein